jgi:glycosyltransferase involved in cell wall biosynthesis
MKIWLPYVDTGGGADVFSERLASGLGALGHSIFMQRFPHHAMFFPWQLRAAMPPCEVDASIASAHYAFALKRPNNKLIAIEHHCVLDPAYAPYRSFPQSVYHELVVRRFEKASLSVADALVACSHYTANSIHAALGGPRAHVILNGIETDFFCPATPKLQREGQSARLLFVGNLIRRKGADLLPKIMRALGPAYELRYTTGLRTSDPFPGAPGMTPLGRLTREQLRDEYRRADLLLFPTRFEGFGYAAAEALACGTPVVTTRGSSLPEVVDDGVTGRLCATDDIEDFVGAVKTLVADKAALIAMGHEARRAAEERFDLNKMAKKYTDLIETLVLD